MNYSRFRIFVMAASCFFASCSVSSEGVGDERRPRGRLDDRQVGVLMSEGSADAALKLSDHYYSIPGVENEQMGFQYLMQAYNLGSAEAANFLVNYHLSRGECISAKRAFDAAGRFKESDLFLGIGMSESVENCFERPLGEGSWMTRVE